MSLIDVFTKLDMALLLLKANDLQLVPDGKGQYWLCSVCVMSKAICVSFSLVLLL